MKRNLKVVVHGDDFFSNGSVKELWQLDQDLKKHFEMKTEMLGPNKEAGEVQEIRFLNRILAWHDEGISWEADPRHAEMVVKQLGLEGGRSAATPGAKEETKTMEKDSHSPQKAADMPSVEDIMSIVHGKTFEPPKGERKSKKQEVQEALDRIESTWRGTHVSA